MMFRAPRNDSGTAKRIAKAVAMMPRKIVTIISPVAVSQNVSNSFCGVRIEKSNWKSCSRMLSAYAGLAREVSMSVTRRPTAMTATATAIVTRRRQSVSGVRSSSFGTGRPRSRKYVATALVLDWKVGIERRRVDRVARLARRRLRADLDLDRVLAIDVAEATLVDRRRSAVESDLARLQRDDTRAVPAREREEMQRADDGDAFLAVDFLEVLHHRVA